MALPLVLFAVLAPTIQARTSDAQDERTNLKARFVHDLARNGRFQWKSVTFLFNRDTVDDWIIDVSIPKTMFELPAAEDDSLILSTTMTLTQKFTSSTNAYVILSNQQSNAMMKRSIDNMLSSKRLDATKTFILFSERTEEFLVDSDVDLIAVEERRTWNPRTEAVNKPVLKFRRRRTLSTLKPSEMTGVYDGTTALTEAQKRILFDTSFSYGGREVRVTTFPVPPTTVKCADNASKFCGRDPNLIRHIGELLHFDPVFVLPEPLATKWGDKLDNGSWTGLIGSVSSGKTTLGVANVFTSLHYLEQVEMSYPYDSSCSTFLTPAPEVWPQFYTLVKPFDISLWLATIFSLFFGGLLIQMMAKVYYRLFGSRDPLRFFGEAMIYNAQSITGVRSGSEERSPWPVRAYNSFWWLFCFVIGTIYRTGLTSWLASSPILTQPIDTIEQLVHSGLTPYGFNTFVRDLAQYSIDPYTIELGRRLQVISSNFTVEKIMGGGKDNAFYENTNYLKYLSVTILPGSMGNTSIKSIDPRQRLHVMHECLQSFPVAIPMTTGTPLKPAMTQIIHRLNAAGLLVHWLDTVVHNEKITTKFTKKSNDQQPFSLYCLEGAFYLLLLCYSIDIVAFLGEIAFYRLLWRRKSKQIALRNE